MTTTTGYNWDGKADPENAKDFSPLKAGEYQFKVIKFQRGYHQQKAGGKLPSCHRAEIEIDVDGRTLRDSIPLHPDFDWKICSFFKALGFQPESDGLFDLKHFDDIMGREGACKIKIRSVPSTKNPGENIEVNDVDRYLAPDSVQPKTPDPVPEMPAADDDSHVPVPGAW